MEEGSADFKENQARFSAHNLSPLEHYLMGSTPSNFNSTTELLLSIKEAIKGDKEAMETIRKPLVFGDATIEQINEERFNAFEKNGMVGIFRIFNDAQVKLSIEHNLELYVELGAVDKDSGLIPVEWNVWLVDNKRHEIVRTPDKNVFKQIDIDEDLKDIFELSEVQDEGYRKLRLKTS